MKSIFYIFLFTLAFTSSSVFSDELRIINVEKDHPELYKEVQESKKKKKSLFQKLLGLHKYKPFKTYSCYHGIRDLHISEDESRRGWVYASTLEDAESKVVGICINHYAPRYSIEKASEMCEEMLIDDEFGCAIEWLEMRIEF